jgi:phage shock protein C
MEAGVYTQKRLYKSRRNRVIDGICGGIAEYFDIDVTIVRILWVLLTLLGGSGFFLYIAAMIIMPSRPSDAGADPSGSSASQPADKRRFWGITLVLLGAFVLLINLGWLADVNWWSFSHRVFLPSLLIILGLVLVYTYRRRHSSLEPPPGDPASAAPPPPPGVTVKELRRSIRDRKVFGVCGGLATYFNVDPTIVRVLYLIVVLASFGWGLLLYIILAIVMPEEKPGMSAPLGAA